jgi:hypothetical protein
VIRRRHGAVPSVDDVLAATGQPAGAQPPSGPGPAGHVASGQGTTS